MAPNTALRQARLALRLSQDEMAVAIRDAGQRLGTPNGCSKRLVQRWEAGEVTLPRAVYIRALEYVTGKPVASLGFDTAAERYGLDPDEALATGSGPWIPVADPKAQPGPLIRKMGPQLGVRQQPAAEPSADPGLQGCGWRCLGCDGVCWLGFGGEVVAEFVGLAAQRAELAGLLAGVVVPVRA